MAQPVLAAALGAREFGRPMWGAVASAPRAVIASLALTGVALAIWASSLRQIDINRTNDLGLVSILPLPMVVALALLSIAFAIAVHERRAPRPWLMLLQILALVAMLYGTATLVEPVARFHPTWRHIGVTETIIRTGQVDPSIDAYFNWPGFFALSGLVTELVGLPALAALAAWAPVAFSLLYLGPLVMIFESLSADRRLTWLAAWIFYVANWIGQDYFAPQAFAFLLHLVLIGIVLRWFKVTPAEPGFLGDQRLGALARIAHLVYARISPDETVNARSRARTRAALVAVIIVLFVAIVAGHQLTPFATLGAVLGLVVANRTTLKTLPVLMIVIILAWLSFPAEPYLRGHFGAVAADVGQVGANLSSTVAQRLQGSPEHRTVVYVRLLTTAVVWLLAFAGAARRIRHGRWDVSAGVLMLSPFPLLGLQDYGGEILLRVYLFTLPFAAFFVAALVFPRPVRAPSWLVPVVLAISTVALAGGFVVSRYGNERMDYFTANELAAVERLYEIAPEGSLLVAVTRNLPWKFHGYELYHYRPTGSESMLDVPAIKRELQSRRYNNAFLILTRSQRAYAELFLGVPSTTWDGLERQLAASPDYRLVYENPDAKIYAARRPGS